MEGPPPVCFRQCSFTYGAEPSTLHISQQCFSDYVWILVTEDDTCVPGVVLRFDPHDAGPCVGCESLNNLPSLPCEYLLGVRDHALTNILSSAIAHAIQSVGEQRPLLLCVSAAKTAKRLQTTEERMSFVRMVREKVVALAKGETC
ncbi:uncharacterized protein TEOVI_000225000 [Trypanosoma equiperdum]|uniref:Proteasome assembly chaperone 3 n=2 Tax=Trypanozoon TaxID=39700 RepID=Q57ZB5_TRYB2|nr:hypothetical protein, conserved [Trypanosoma brucei brucei TREU927]AAX80223.1 hypothetical protein, conserved [Trypanosoma brucei]AAZ10231.1 hypothetical protein, conserved [Trypanosoma brucei brucei TREU927]SCU70676.1 hypothetical protein, conserved [Trypanosoma equiperdum]